MAAASEAELQQAVTALSSAFQARPDLRDAFIKKSKTTKQSTDLALYKDLAAYVLDLQAQAHASQDAIGNPATKKRKLDGEALVNGSARPQAGAASLKATWSGTVFEGVSFSIPQRKKLSLEISPQHAEGARALNPTTKEVEFGIPWADTEQVVVLPVPEKAQASKNFLFFPKGGDGISGTNSDNPAYEPMVWTAADTLPKGADENTQSQASSILGTLKSIGIDVQEPSESEFASEIPQPHRKGEKAYHVKGFRGSKDGYLFFLPNGIVWGFKKPLIFFSFQTIDSVSYTSILQRTFNLNIAARPATSDAEPTEYEFSMLDQADFAGIDAYLKKHKLQDASMAEQRRAKKLNINGVRGKNQEESQQGEDEESELTKAQREAELQADDDEDESDDENFDPGSEGESEGSGTDDDESGEEGGQKGGDEDDEDEDE